MGDDYILDLKSKCSYLLLMRLRPSQHSFVSENYLVKSDEKYDKIPEIWEGHNIADFVDPNIREKVAALIEEENLRVNAGFYDDDMESDDDETRELREQARQ